MHNQLVVVAVVFQYRKMLNVTNTKQVNYSTMRYISRNILLKSKSLWWTTLGDAVNVVSNGIGPCKTMDSGLPENKWRMNE